MDRIAERAKCPFFLGIVRNRRIVGIECEPIDPNLGFKVSHFVRVRTFRDLDDYTDIFCCDMWATCPYCQALMEMRYNKGSRNAPGP